MWLSIPKYSRGKLMGRNSFQMVLCIKDNSTQKANSMVMECYIILEEKFVTQAVGKAIPSMDLVYCIINIQ